MEGEIAKGAKMGCGLIVRLTGRSRRRVVTVVVDLVVWQRMPQLRANAGVARCSGGGNYSYEFGVKRSVASRVNPQPYYG
jgi:hypothetical protein